MPLPKRKTNAQSAAVEPKAAEPKPAEPKPAGPTAAKPKRLPRAPLPLPCLLLLGVGVTACGNESAETAPPVPLSFRAISINTGTTDGLAHNAPPEDGYSTEQAALSDEFYGNGLAWKRVVADARQFFEASAPDVVAFQELFHSPDCANIPDTARAGFVCEDWEPGDPSVVQLALGAGYQVACHLDKPDKCIAVRKSFGSFVGCDQELCEDGLAGARVPDCGGGSRIGRGVIELQGGRQLTIVNIHGSSGITQQDQDCRVQQFKQVFEALDPALPPGTDNPPAANGELNLVLGDLNTDPGRHFDFDESAAYFASQAGPSESEAGPAGFFFVSAVGSTAQPSYGGLFNIDHVVSDGLNGTCVTPGITEGLAPVSDMIYFDHKPVVCDLSE